MRKFITASLLLASTAFVHAADVTVLSTNVPATRGPTTVETRFHIDTEMKEAYAMVQVDEQITVYVRDCSYGGGYGGGPRGPGYPYPYPGPGRGGRYPYPQNYCRDYPQTRYNTVLTDKVKIEGVTMNGDEVIYQGANGDVVCGTMGRSRVLRVPTFYLSGKCTLVDNTYMENGVKKLSVTFRTK